MWAWCWFSLQVCVLGPMHVPHSAMYNVECPVSLFGVIKRILLKS